MQRFKNILLVHSEDHSSAPAFQRAIYLAAVNRAQLHVIDVLSPGPITSGLHVFSDKLEQLGADLKKARQGELERLIGAQNLSVEVRVEVLTGKPFVEIIQYAQRYECDIVVKSVSQEKRLLSYLFGSSDLRLLRKCPCPVYLIRPDDDRGTRAITAAVDLENFDGESPLDDMSRQIVEIASSIAFQERSELHIVNAWMVFDGENLAKKLSKHYAEDVTAWKSEQMQAINRAQQGFVEVVQQILQEKNMASLKCQFHFIEGEAEDVIIDVSRQVGADLIVMGTVGRTDIAGFFLGNTSEAIVNAITCSVLAVKPPGFVSPVSVERG